MGTLLLILVVLSGCLLRDSARATPVAVSPNQTQATHQDEVHVDAHRAPQVPTEHHALSPTVVQSSDPVHTTSQAQGPAKEQHHADHSVSPQGLNDNRVGFAPGHPQGQLSPEHQQPTNSQHQAGNSNHPESEDRQRPFHRPGYHRPGYNRPGYNRPGYNRPGYNRPWYQRPGYNRPGYNRPSYNRPGGYPWSGGYPNRYPYGPHVRDSLFEPAVVPFRYQPGDFVRASNLGTVIDTLLRVLSRLLGPSGGGGAGGGGTLGGGGSGSNDGGDDNLTLVQDGSLFLSVSNSTGPVKLLVALAEVPPGVQTVTDIKLGGDSATANAGLFGSHPW